MKKLEQQQRAQLTTLRNLKPILQVYLQVNLLDSDQLSLKATNGTINEPRVFKTCFGNAYYNIHIINGFYKTKY